MKEKCFRCIFVDECESSSECLAEYINKNNTNFKKDKKEKYKKYTKEKNLKE